MDAAIYGSPNQSRAFDVLAHPVGDASAIDKDLWTADIQIEQRIMNNGFGWSTCHAVNTGFRTKRNRTQTRTGTSVTVNRGSSALVGNCRGDHEV